MTRGRPFNSDRNTYINSAIQQNADFDLIKMLSRGSKEDENMSVVINIHRTLNFLVMENTSISLSFSSGCNYICSYLCGSLPVKSQSNGITDVSLCKQNSRWLS